MADRVLVTGATGFVAGHCIAELASHGYQVRGTVRSPEKAAGLAGTTEPVPVELVRADLESDDGWAEAVAGCAYVLHIASPFPLAEPADADEIVRPAVEGTLRLLRASAESGTVRRVVLTSSVAAIHPSHGSTGTRTEDDWADPDHSDAYQRSKILAERAAWDFARADGRAELTVVNPGLVLGPVRPAASASLEVVRQLLAREVPGVPRLGWAVVDVRDLAVAHRLAMELPRAAGNRYICAGQNVWMRDIARVLAAKYRVPTRPVPYWLAWLVARFDPSVRSFLPSIGQPEQVSSAKAMRELGWSMRPLEETIMDTAASLYEHHLVRT